MNHRCELVFVALVNCAIYAHIKACQSPNVHSIHKIDKKVESGSRLESIESVVDGLVDVP